MTVYLAFQSTLIIDPRAEPQPRTRAASIASAANSPPSKGCKIAYSGQTELSRRGDRGGGKDNLHPRNPATA